MARGPDRRLRIGIAGAGIAGLSAGAFLARAGHHVTLYDRFDAPAPVGSGLMVQPVGMAVLDALGAGAALRDHAARVTRLLGRRTGDGRMVLDVRYASLRRGLAGHACQRAALFAVLLAAAEAAGVRLAPGHEITGAEPGPEPVLLAGAERLGPFDLVLDCLGANSPLCPRPGRLLPFGALWCLVPAAGSVLPPDRLEQRYHAARRMAGVLPVGTRPGDPEPRITLFWSLRAADHAAWCAAPLAAWRDAFRADFPEAAPLLEAVESHADITFARYRHRTLGRPVSGRIAHLGDSHHAASPQLGQGANMALLDAAALAAAVAGTAGPDAALAAYARWRRLHVGLYTAASWAFTPAYQSESRVLPWLRDRLLAPLSQVWPMPTVLAALVAGEIGGPRRGIGPLLAAAPGETAAPLPPA
ncbi:NAD(P)/FAD-dependent oxidoreductase [Paralimibaculum aggregatum]|uniref:NAD(P)/FAD-dependent oxidoreductase n=1 Tax=Paralimibaculum aggregatum TaxID=3036245 RepID=A0ABQ6LBZ0_9RHOB|nr:NAD(P)/FAD-dependent oxidoreductase [Limibaculum sp. NKW23]GMG80911.1 NAD(P)/FAD-dependent oxidoreductase [Limibaculum sp. NKW23]